LTAHARPEDRLLALAAGFQMHVVKPVDEYELVTVVASLTGRLSRRRDATETPLIEKVVSGQWPVVS
ncbi:MAG: hypothetical protein ACREVR_06675, partial [Burkholderiales bacterium]